jgi:hypothetical protein
MNRSTPAIWASETGPLASIARICWLMMLSWSSGDEKMT